MHIGEAVPSVRVNGGSLATSPVRQEVQVQELWLRPLRTAAEVAEIMHLRNQIPLPAEVLADPGFAALEKKGMRPASWRPSSGAAARSGH